MQERKTHIKICGITRLEDARYCAAAGADYLGFIQVNSSPRRVDAETAREIIQWVHGPQTVGVFMDVSIDEVNRTAETAGFDLVQLHGSETPEMCRSVERPVIKTLRVGEQTSAAQIVAFANRYREFATFLLLDTYDRWVPGGTGTSFQHSVAADAIGEANFFIAGGIHSGNVAGVVASLDPYGVDVASGVESAPGLKDFEKVDRLFEALKKSPL
jgi:phosphoribosylanthranilate isomerase